MAALGTAFPFHALHRHAELEGDGRFELGPGAVVGSSRLVAAEGHRVVIGASTWIGDDCEIGAGPEIIIGSRTSLQHRSQVLGNVSIGSGCVCAANLFASSGWHRFADAPPLPVRVQDFRARADGSPGQPIHIGDDCWIGINVVILPGVTIGRGCVVGANSVVRSDLPPYSIAVGSPARVVKTRLAFEPPLAIRAGNDGDLPYFYAGFRQLGTDETADAQCVRTRGGWAAAARFSVALDARAGDHIVLEVDARKEGRLFHGDAQCAVNGGGLQQIGFSARPGRWNLLDFCWQPAAADASGESLVVLAATASAKRSNEDPS
jgi:acetyltransferase-like isoleucine patch superfamily enzyme